MKVKYKETEIIEKEGTLLEVLNLENNFEREGICIEKGHNKILIDFYSDHKEIIIKHRDEWFWKVALTLRTNTIFSNKKIVSMVEQAIKEI